MAGRSPRAARTSVVLGVGLLSFLVAVRLVTWLTDLEFGLPLVVAKAFGLFAIAALRPAVPSGMLLPWRLWLAGGALNLLAIFAGGGRMPISSLAISGAALPPPPPDYVLATGALQLLLGDSIPVRWPITTAISAGDLVLVAGLLWFAHALVTVRSAATEA